MLTKWILSTSLVLILLKTSAQSDSIARDTSPGLPSLIIPTVLTGYGFAALGWEPLKTFDQHVRETVWLDHTHHTFQLDNYLQYGPAAAVYVLNAAGVKGWHDLGDRTVIYVTANIFLAVPVLSLKKFIKAPRPDGSGDDGFPSGHTATAFAAAEFMRQEFRDRSVWYGVAAYATATGVAYLRVYNDKHWFSEVLTGAGIGILAAKAAYWVFPFISRKILRRPARPVDL
ncbi:MAG: hypothetical protein BGO55_21585 [Sphingobacteriales bacterium 50-39]|nr:phosphatase PAP2 family protein [Sphingobacteriales bacterium]OJW59582.1 MAG: hypothetical protein BGO55_21585 [Sphingobacteriales bacterium 50-39]